MQPFHHRRKFWRAALLQTVGSQCSPFFMLCRPHHQAVIFFSPLYTLSVLIKVFLCQRRWRTAGPCLYSSSQLSLTTDYGQALLLDLGINSKWGKVPVHMWLLFYWMIIQHIQPTIYNQYTINKRVYVYSCVRGKLWRGERGRACGGTAIREGFSQKEVCEQKREQSERVNHAML